MYSPHQLGNTAPGYVIQKKIMIADSARPISKAAARTQLYFATQISACIPPEEIRERRNIHHYAKYLLLIHQLKIIFTSTQLL
jgi:hypothetical protein